MFTKAQERKEKMHVPEADSESRKLKQKQSNWSNKNPTQTLVIYSSCRKCQIILNDQEQLELWLCLVSVLTAEPPSCPGNTFFSQEHIKINRQDILTPYCVWCCLRKKYSPLMTKPLLLVLQCPPKTHSTQTPMSAEQRGRYGFLDVSKPRLEEHAWTAPAVCSNSLDFPGVT